MTKYLRCINTEDHYTKELVLGRRYEITNESEHGYFVGNLGHYTKEPDSGGRSYRMWFILESENKSEGGESMVIDGVNYREVKRKAAVGERVLAINDDTVPFVYSGASGVVRSTSTDDVYATFDHGKYDGEDDSTWYVNHTDYVVLEPITESTEPADIAAEDAEIIVLQRQLNRLRQETAEIDRKQAEVRLQVDGLTEAFAKLVTKQTAVAPVKLTRGDVVKRAADDVADLTSDDNTKYAMSMKLGHVKVEFIVDRSKRTVVALLRLAYVDGCNVYGRGIAKAAPGDVFNETIGRAISLRRALGLEVPAEYTNAPKPEGVAVGDVIIAEGKYRTVVSDNILPISGEQVQLGSFYARYGKVVDDSARYNVNGKVAA